MFRGGMCSNNYNNLREQLGEVLVYKKKGVTEEVLKDKRKHVSALLVMLKKHSRQDKFVLKQGRDDLVKKKNLVDSFRLQLQNLLYEINHLKKEIRNCYLFKSLDEDIDLLPTEDYCISNSVAPHKLRLLCLQSELNLRKHLHIDYTNLIKTKKLLYKDILLKIERHALFVPALKVLVKATKPLKEALQISLSEDWKLNELVNLLPKPLYLTYVNLQAVQQAFELSCEVGVVESEVNQESNIKQSSINSFENSEYGFPKPAKYMIRITIDCPIEAVNCLTLDIRYFSDVDVVSVSSVISQTSENSTSKEFFDQDVLQFVIDKDLGNVFPNPASELKLRKFNMTASDCLKYFADFGYGKPYEWLQKFCFIKLWNEKKVQKFMVDIIGKTMKLWCHHTSILKQITTLTNKSYDFYLQSNPYNYKPFCGLAQWTAIKWLDYESQLSTNLFKKSFLVDKHCNFYRAVLVRGSAKLECFVGILGKLTFSDPVWALCLHWNGVHTARNNALIKEMEFRVNSLKKSESNTSSEILFHQLLLTMMNLDLYLESACILQNSNEFVADNMGLQHSKISAKQNFNFF